jgi:hypothetical protein
MNENHCRVLGAYSRPDLEIVLDRCKLTSAGASALSEVLEQNQGPTKFAPCEIDSFVLVNGLRGNSRLESLRPRLSSTPEDGNRKVLVIADALKETKGLVVLLLIHDFRMSDETWGAVCDSLKTQDTSYSPSLESQYIWYEAGYDGSGPSSDQVTDTGTRGHAET